VLNDQLSVRRSLWDSFAGMVGSPGGGVGPDVSTAYKKG
jgi:hypothetical protein